MRPITALLLIPILGIVTLDEVMARDKQKQKVTYFKEDELFLSMNIDNGSKLQLSDGTTYLIDPEDRIYSSYWITPFPIKLSKSNDEDFPTLITNLTTGTSVKGIKISTKDLLEAEAKKELDKKGQTPNEGQLQPSAPEENQIAPPTPQQKKPLPPKKPSKTPKIQEPSSQ